MSWKIFSGIEAEGPYTNHTVLFVEGKAPYNEVACALIDTGLSYIYFGANFKQFKGPSDIDYAQVYKVIKRLYTTVEGSIKDYNFLHFLNSSEFRTTRYVIAFVNVDSIDDILELNNIPWPSDRTYVKLTNKITKKLALIRLENIQKPDTSLYEKDELLKEFIEVSEGD